MSSSKTGSSLTVRCLLTNEDRRVHMLPQVKDDEVLITVKKTGTLALPIGFGC